MVRPKDDFYPNFQITGISREDADRIVAAVRDDDQLWNALIEMQKMPDADDEGVWFGLYKAFMRKNYPEFERWSARLQPMIAYTLWSEKELNRQRFSAEMFERMYSDAPEPQPAQIKFSRIP